MKEIEELGYSIQELQEMKKNSDDFRDFCFQFVKAVGKNEDKIKKAAELIGSSYITIILAANNYKDGSRTNYHNPYKAIDKRDKYIKSGYGKQFDGTIERILDAKTDDEVLELFNQEEYRVIFEKKDTIFNYLINMYPNDFRDKLKDIKTKIALYRDSKKKKKEEKKITRDEALYIAAKILSDREVGNFTEALIKYDIRPQDAILYTNAFREIIISKEMLYDTLQKHFDENKNNTFLEKYYNDIIKLLPLTLAQIPIGEQYRRFDELDALTYFKEDFGKIFDGIKHAFVLDKTEENREMVEQIAVLKSTLYANMTKKNAVGFSSMSISPELEEAVINNILNSRTNYTYEGGKTLSDDDKKAIIQEMRENGIPITTNTFELVLKRYCNGKLELITKENIDDVIDSIDKRKRK